MVAAGDAVVGDEQLLYDEGQVVVEESSSRGGIVEWETFSKEYRTHVMTSYAEPFPLVIADGVYLVDAEGRRYLDF